MACVFVNIFEIREFFDSGVMNNLRSAHQINVLEAFLQGNLGLLRSLILDNGPVLIGDEFRDYTYYFTHCLIMPFLSM